MNFKKCITYNIHIWFGELFIWPPHILWIISNQILVFFYCLCKFYLGIWPSSPTPRSWVLPLYLIILSCTCFLKSYYFFRSPFLVFNWCSITAIRRLKREVLNIKSFLCCGLSRLRRELCWCNQQMCFSSTILVQWCTVGVILLSLKIPGSTQ